VCHHVSNAVYREIGPLKIGTKYLQKRWVLSLVNLFFFFRKRVRKAIISGMKRKGIDVRRKSSKSAVK
jgi:hypothetical protein